MSGVYWWCKSCRCAHAFGEWCPPPREQAAMNRDEAIQVAHAVHRDQAVEVARNWTIPGLVDALAAREPL